MARIIKFHWADYLVFCLSLLISAGIGVYFAFAGKKKKNTSEISDFLMGGKDVNLIPVALSMVASFLSAIYIIGVPAEIYYYGISFAFLAVGYALVNIAGAVIFVPLFHRMDVISAHETIAPHLWRLAKNVKEKKNQEGGHRKYLKMDNLKFHWADYLVFCLSLLISAAIGVYFAVVDRKKDSVKVFLIGGGNMNAFPVGLSILASFLSAIYVIGVPAEIYYFGITFAFLSVGYIVVILTGAHVFVPLFHSMGGISANQYLEKRFSKTIRVMGSLTFIVMMLLYLAVVLYAPALAFTQVTGLPMWLTIVGSGVICTFYTTMGGMKAVIWTDTFQMCIIIVGLFILIIKGTMDVGGISEVWDRNVKGGRLNLTAEELFGSGFTTRTNFWTQSVGAFFTYASLCGANQTVIQRYLTIKKTVHAQISLYVVLFFTLLCLALVTMLGLIIYAYYQECDPLVAGLVEKPDQIVPLFMMEVMGHLHGLPGLFTASVFAAALSTVSSAVNSLAAVLLEDMIRPTLEACHRDPLSDKAMTWLARILAVIFGIITIGLSYVAPLMGPLLTQISLSIFGTAGGPLFSVFALGIFVPCCNSWGAGIGLIASICVTYWVSIGGIIYPNRATPLPIGFCLASGSSPANGSWLNDTDMQFMTTAFHDAMTTMPLTTVLTPLVTEAPLAPAVKWLYSISYMWYGLVSVVVAFVVGILVSALTCFRKGREPLNPNYIYSFVDHCCCCCPESCKDNCRCGLDLDYEEEEVTKKELELDNVQNGTEGLQNPAFTKM